MIPSNAKIAKSSVVAIALIDRLTPSTVALLNPPAIKCGSDVTVEVAVSSALHERRAFCFISSTNVGIVLIDERRRNTIKRSAIIG